MDANPGSSGNALGAVSLNGQGIKPPQSTIAASPGQPVVQNAPIQLQNVQVMPSAGSNPSAAGTQAANIRQILAKNNGQPLRIQQLSGGGNVIRLVGQPVQQQPGQIMIQGGSNIRLAQAPQNQTIRLVNTNQQGQRLVLSQPGNVQTSQAGVLQNNLGQLRIVNLGGNQLASLAGMQIRQANPSQAQHAATLISTNSTQPILFQGQTLNQSSNIQLSNAPVNIGSKQLMGVAQPSNSQQQAIQIANRQPQIPGGNQQLSSQPIRLKPASGTQHQIIGQAGQPLISNQQQSQANQVKIQQLNLANANIRQVLPGSASQQNSAKQQLILSTGSGLQTQPIVIQQLGQVQGASIQRPGQQTVVRLQVPQGSQGQVLRPANAAQIVQNPLSGMSTIAQTKLVSIPTQAQTLVVSNSLTPQSVQSVISSNSSGTNLVASSLNTQSYQDPTLSTPAAQAISVKTVAHPTNVNTGAKQAVTIAPAGENKSAGIVTQQGSIKSAKNSLQNIDIPAQIHKMQVALQQIMKIANTPENQPKIKDIQRKIQALKAYHQQQVRLQQQKQQTSDGTAGTTQVVVGSSAASSSQPGIGKVTTVSSKDAKNLTAALQTGLGKSLVLPQGAQIRPGTTLVIRSPNSGTQHTVVVGNQGQGIRLAAPSATGQQAVRLQGGQISLIRSASPSAGSATGKPQQVMRILKSSGKDGAKAHTVLKSKTLLRPVLGDDVLDAENSMDSIAEDRSDCSTPDQHQAKADKIIQQALDKAAKEGRSVPKIIHVVGGEKSILGIKARAKDGIVKKEIKLKVVNKKPKDAKDKTPRQIRPKSVKKKKVPTATLR